MKVGLVVDATCDLPRDFIEANGIVVLPITIRKGNKSFVDRRDEALSLAFYADKDANNDDEEAISVPLSSEQIEALFLQQLVTTYDYVFCLTITSSRSKIYENAVQASYGIVAKYKQHRRAVGVTTRFSMVVLNSRNIFTGQGVLAAETIRLINDGAVPSIIDARIRELVPNTHCYMVPPALEHMYRQASKRGDKSVTWAAFTFGSMLDIKPILYGHMDQTGPVDKLRGFDEAVERMFGVAQREVEKGLLVPHICLSYGGDLSALDRMPGYGALIKAAQDRGVGVLRSIMSASSGTKVGPGCVTVAFAAANHKYK